MSQLTQSVVWRTLSQLAEKMQGQHMRDWFKTSPERAEKYCTSACGITLDYSKNLIDEDVKKSLLELAQQTDVEAKRDAMFRGDIINTTEQRAVLHTALRNLSSDPVYVNNIDVMPDVMACLDKMQKFVESIHTGRHLGHTGEPITDVVALGIGGSFLGPKIMSEALKPYTVKNVNVHFIANVDGSHIQDVLANLSAQQTLVIMSSKSFSTQETLQNTITARDWFYAQGGSQKDIAKHFVAVSSNTKAATEFGIAEDNIFPMWDWVGGRYSMWSAIGLPWQSALALTISKRYWKAHMRWTSILKMRLPTKTYRFYWVYLAFGIATSLMLKATQFYPTIII